VFVSDKVSGCPGMAELEFECTLLDGSCGKGARSSLFMKPERRHSANLKDLSKALNPMNASIEPQWTPFPPMKRKSLVSLSSGNSCLCGSVR
jgi:hypothetical protein